MIKKIGLIFLGLVIITSLDPFNFTTGQIIPLTQNQNPISSFNNNSSISPALLPLSQDRESEKDCFSVITRPGAVTEQIENLGLPNPTSAIKIESEQNILAVIDWVEKEKEVDEARLTSSVPLGIQCGGRTLSPFGIGPVFPRICCTGCCVPCIPFICCGDCGCCVASCAVKCTCISGPGSGYLWDSVTGLCGCGI